MTSSELTHEELEERVSILEQRLARLQHELHWKNESWAKKNRELDALHYVWCDGGCPRGVHRWQDSPITGDIVKEAEKQAKRLRSWWNSYHCRRGTPCVCGHPFLTNYPTSAPYTDHGGKNFNEWGTCKAPGCDCQRYVAPTEGEANGA
jgi:hypothetical protein